MLTCGLVYVDIETGGLSIKRHEILQMAAITEATSGELMTFNVYVTPTKEIDPNASAVNKLITRNGQLYYKQEAVATRPLRESLESFILFLESISTTNPTISLIGHNFVEFDLKFLRRDMQRYGLLERFEKLFDQTDNIDVTLPTTSTMVSYNNRRQPFDKVNVVHVRCNGMIDTLHLFRAFYPFEQCYKQTSLVNKFLELDTDNVFFDAHNALNDVKVLKQLFEKTLLPKLSS